MVLTIHHRLCGRGGVRIHDSDDATTFVSFRQSLRKHPGRCATGFGCASLHPVIPRGPRLDAPGALHHIIVRGIERSTIFRDDTDRAEFLGRSRA